MNKKFFILSFLLFLIYVLIFNLPYLKGSWFAAVFFSKGKTAEEVIKKYEVASSTPETKKLKILLVPGHEPNFGGAEYKNLLERNLNVTLSNAIFDLLENDKKIEVIKTRDIYGWNSIFVEYFNKNMPEIEKWVNSQKKEMSNLISAGQIIKPTPSVIHNDVSKNIALRLYGINKWANDNSVDITLHIHFNDVPHVKNVFLSEGFSIYIPDKQYSNSSSSSFLAKKLFQNLSTINSVSNLKGESLGIIEDQELIAIGSYNTVDSIVALVEYAYIYESELKTEASRKIFIEKAASATLKSIVEFLEKK